MAASMTAGNALATGRARSANENCGPTGRSSVSESRKREASLVKVLNDVSLFLPCNGERQRSAARAGSEEKMINAVLQTALDRSIGPNLIDHSSVSTSRSKSAFKNISVQGYQ